MDPWGLNLKRREFINKLGRCLLAKEVNSDKPEPYLIENKFMVLSHLNISGA